VATDVQIFSSEWKNSSLQHTCLYSSVPASTCYMSCALSWQLVCVMPMQLSLYKCTCTVELWLQYKQYIKLIRAIHQLPGVHRFANQAAWVKDYQAGTDGWWAPRAAR
jgi:hypothetical protein